METAHLVQQLHYKSLQEQPLQHSDFSLGVTSRKRNAHTVGMLITKKGEMEEESLHVGRPPE